LAAPVDAWLADHERQGALSEKGNGTGSVVPHPGFKLEPGLSEFFRRDLRGPPGWPADNGGDAAAIFEQATLVLRLETCIRESGEMQHRPKAIVSVGEIMTRDKSRPGRGREYPVHSSSKQPAHQEKLTSDMTNGKAKIRSSLLRP
jgi:hypothetical protein